MCKDYIIPKLLKKYELEGIKFSDKVIEKIITNYTKEAGARDLERVIDKIFRRILVDIEKKVEVKLNITEKTINEMESKDEKEKRHLEFFKNLQALAKK